MQSHLASLRSPVQTPLLRKVKRSNRCKTQVCLMRYNGTPPSVSARHGSPSSLPPSQVHTSLQSRGPGQRQRNFSVQRCLQAAFEDSCLLSPSTGQRLFPQVRRALKLLPRACPHSAHNWIAKVLDVRLTDLQGLQGLQGRSPMGTQQRRSGLSHEHTLGMLSQSLVSLSLHPTAEEQCSGGAAGSSGSPMQLDNSAFKTACRVSNLRGL